MKKLFALAFLFASCTEEQLPDLTAPAALTCAAVDRHGIDAFTAPIDGKIVVVVTSYYYAYPVPDEHRAPLEGAVVRVVKDGFVKEVTTPASGCVEIADASLAPPLAVHVFGPDGVSESAIADPRRAQELLIEVQGPEVPEPDPNDPPPDPPRSFVSFTVSGVDRLPQPSPGEEHLAGAYFAPEDAYPGYDAFIFSVEDPTRPWQTVVPVDRPMTILAAGGPGYIGDEFAYLRPVLLDVVEVPGIPDHEVQTVPIDLSIPIETPVAFEVETPASPISGVGIGVAVVLPNDGAGLYLSSTSTGGEPLRAPKLEGKLAGASLRATASMFKQEPPTYGWEDIALFVTIDSTDETIRFPEWPTRTGEVTLVERTFRVPVDGVDRCRFRHRGWGVSRYAPPWEFTMPIPPEGHMDSFNGELRVTVTCWRHPPGSERWGDYREREASWQMIIR
jgi:hypothetical protein